MKRWLILGIICFAAIILATTALPVSIANAQAITCASDVPAARGGHWYYRIIDGRKCWYQGKPMMPKTSLQWQKPSISEAEVAKPASGGDTARIPAKPATDGRNVSASGKPATENRIAPPAPAAWPAPVRDVMDDRGLDDGGLDDRGLDDHSFESRWRGLKPES